MTLSRSHKFNYARNKQNTAQCEIDKQIDINIIYKYLLIKQIQINHASLKTAVENCKALVGQVLKIHKAKR